tara:strand:- start:304 stop:510 length:207 start_codon:yes stop_codon:yes gene_type:complete
MHCVKIARLSSSIEPFFVVYVNHLYPNNVSFFKFQKYRPKGKKQSIGGDIVGVFCCTISSRFSCPIFL